MPASAATAISATLVVPQSAVTISVRPSARARSMAPSDSPWPSSTRLGTYGCVSIPRRRSASVRIARPVRPSASKSPKTIARSPAAAARRTRSRKSGASGSSIGSWSCGLGRIDEAGAARSSVATPTASQHPQRADRRRLAPAPRRATSSGTIGRRRKDSQRWRGRSGSRHGGGVWNSALHAAYVALARLRAAGLAACRGGLSSLAALVPEVPVDQQRRGVEDRRIRPRGDADQQREHERVDRRPTEEEQRSQRRSPRSATC